MSDVVLAIKDLKTVREGRCIHDGVSLDLHAGEILVLLGESGSGKTTLLRTLVGLEAVDGGSCAFDARDLYALDEDDWRVVRTQIAYAFQNGALFDSLTVRENLEFPLREHTHMGSRERFDRVVERLEALGLGRIEELKPAELSGGMQKRVGVARAIMLDPKVVLYDEPTAGLDPENVGRMNETIERLSEEGCATIVVTHDPSCALEVADRFAFLADGRVAAEQSRQDFERSPHPLLRSYFDGVKTSSTRSQKHQTERTLTS